MESLVTIRLSMVFFIIMILTLINDSQCKPGWSFKKLSVWGRSSSKSSTESELESDSSVKHAELCDYICKKEPDEGRKYCDCDSNEIPIESEQSSSEGQKQLTLGDFFKQETNPTMKYQMCSFVCSEDSNEASKYCDCDGLKKPDKSKKTFQTLSDYFKSNVNDKSPNTNSDGDTATRKQLCEYICSDDPDEAKQYCNCNKIREEQNNLIAQQSQNYQHNLNQQQRQGNINKQNGSNGNAQFSIKNYLNPGHGHSQEDICKVICAIEPDNDDGQCGCDEGKKESKFQWPWQRIRQWFGLSNN